MEDIERGGETPPIGKYRLRTILINEQGLYHIISQSTAKSSGQHLPTKKTFRPIGKHPLLT
jgi:hypothetical protein